MQADGTVTLATISLCFGFPSLLAAYALEFRRAYWIANHGVLGMLSHRKKPEDFYCLNRMMTAVLLINLFGSLVPWVIIGYRITEVAGINTMSVLPSIFVFFSMFMSFWEIFTRQLGMCEQYK